MLNNSKPLINGRFGQNAKCVINVSTNYPESISQKCRKFVAYFIHYD